MQREQRLTIKVNHGIEIWSPVNFQVLRNKTAVYQEGNGRWSPLDLLVLFRKQIWSVSFIFPDRWENTYFERKKIHDCSRCGKPFFFCWCGLLTQSWRCSSLKIRKQDNYWPVDKASVLLLCLQTKVCHKKKGVTKLAAWQTSKKYFLFQICLLVNAKC